MRRAAAFGVVVLLSLFLARPALAGPITLYGSRVAFLGATTGVTTLDFEAQNPNGDSGYGWYNTTMVIGDVTFYQPDGRLVVLGKNVYNTSGVTSDYVNAPNAYSTAGVNITFANPVYALGMDLGIVYDWGAQGPGFDTVSFTLSTGDLFSVTAPLLYDSSNPFMFFGFSSPVPFTSLNINSPSQGTAFDNFSYTSNAVGTNPVPEPASLLLFGTGLVGLRAWRKRR